MIKVAGLLAALLLLGGCGLAAKIQARQAMERDRNDYVACLNATPQARAITSCAVQKEIFATDLSIYTATSIGLH